MCSVFDVQAGITLGFPSDSLEYGKCTSINLVTSFGEKADVQLSQISTLPQESRDPIDIGSDIRRIFHCFP